MLLKGQTMMVASQFLDEAKSQGVIGLKGVYIVDSKNCQF